MTRTRFLFLTAVLTVCVFPSRSADCGEITIVYTANSAGKLRECGCPGDPYGGLSERVSMIKQLRKKEQPFLLLDAGNIVSLYGDFSLKTASTMKIMNLMGYNAAAVGQLEMYNGIDNALTMEETAKFPLLSASIARKNTTEPAFKPFVILTVSNQKAGVIAVCDSTCFVLNRTKKPDFDLLPVRQTLASAVETLSREVQFIVVLSHMETDSNKQLLVDFPRIDLVIQGYSNERLETPLQPSRGFLVAPGARGQFVGLITLSKNDRGELALKRSELLPVLDFQEDKKAAEIVSYYYRNMK